MLIEFFIDMVVKVIEWLLSALPLMPTDTYDFVTIFESFANQMAFVNTFFPLDTLFTLTLIVFSVEISISIFHFFRWIFTKVPVVGGTH